MEVLDPASTSVQFAGSQVEVLPVCAGSIPPLIRSSRPVLQALLAGNVLTGDGDEVDVSLIQLVELIGDHGDAVFDALAIASGIKVDAIKAARLDDVLRLARVCIQVNRDFFTQSVAPLLAGMARQLPGAGPTPSSS
ncbi:hypothetical protein ACIPR8_07100 [Stenotrophomonas sp. LARHCG68]